MGAKRISGASDTCAMCGKNHYGVAFCDPCTACGKPCCLSCGETWKGKFYCPVCAEEQWRGEDCLLSLVGRMAWSQVEAMDDRRFMVFHNNLEREYLMRHAALESTRNDYVRLQEVFPLHAREERNYYDWIREDWHRRAREHINQMERATAWREVDLERLRQMRRERGLSETTGDTLSPRKRSGPSSEA